MPTITIDSTNYSVYASVATITAYLQADPVLGPVWEALSEASQKQYAVTATRTLDRQRWPGEKTEDSQTNAWPRTGTGIDGVEDDVVPQAIIDADCLLAGYMANGWTATTTTTASGIKRQKAGSVEIEYFAGGVTTSGTRFPLPVWELLLPYISGSSASSALSFGTSGTSAFDTSFDRSLPF